jgi:hypothetical protein
VLLNQTRVYKRSKKTDCRFFAKLNIFLQNPNEDLDSFAKPVFKTVNIGCSLFFSFDQKAMLFIFSSKRNDNMALFLNIFTIFRKFFNCGNRVCIRFGSFYRSPSPSICVVEVL